MAVETGEISRYVEFAFTCPEGHGNLREIIVISANTPQEAIRAITVQRLTCDVCGVSLPERSEIDVISNVDIPSTSSDL